MMDSEDKRLLSTTVRGTWVQTERLTHEKWATLAREKPNAAALLHVLVANMNSSGAVVASHKTLASLTGISVSSVKRAVQDLVARYWIQTIRVGSQRGGALAYQVNRRVAWADKRSNQRFAAFDARVLASEQDQTEPLDGPELHKIPIMGGNDEQLPHGEGEEPPSQPFIEAFEPDLPAIQPDRSNVDSTPKLDGDEHRQLDAFDNEENNHER